jgi:hypothetical protein
MRPLPHGYTNETLGDAATVVKRYAGPDAAMRAAGEYAALVALHGRIPVPPVLGHGDHDHPRIRAGEARPGPDRRESC